MLVVLPGLLMINHPQPAAAQNVESESARKVINKVVPTYPPIARTMNLTGTVKVEVLVLANGTVKSVQVRGGNPVLAQAAQSAARACKWSKSDHDSTEVLDFRFDR